MPFPNLDEADAGLQSRDPHTRAAAAVADALDAAGAEAFSLPRVLWYLLRALASVTWQVLRCAWQGRAARRRGRHEAAPAGEDEAGVEAADAECEPAPETEADREIDRLRQALARNPRRGDIRLELARELYDAGEAQEFLRVALPLEEVLHEESWERIRAMGHELLPGEYRFFPRVVESEAACPAEFGHATAELDEFSQRRISARSAGARH
ncbi:MAG TPA: hypothetical protein VNX47_14015 [Nevskia sp.]|nr:hypothetical protein [Nevskia sp.]